MLSNEDHVMGMFDKLADRKSNTEYEIRKFQKEDIPDVCRVLNAAFDMGLSSYDERKFAKFIEEDYSFVASEKGSVIGVLLACRMPSASMEAIYIDSFAIAEYVRGCGAGKQFKALSVLKQGEVCRNYGYLSTLEDGAVWLYVQRQNIVGFINAKYLHKEE
jgi:hypothetical protein